MMVVDPEQVKGQLMVIEHVYGIRFAGRADMAELIASAAADDRQATRICTAINTWAAAQRKAGAVSMPAALLQELIRRVKA